MPLPPHQLQAFLFFLLNTAFKRIFQNRQAALAADLDGTAMRFAQKFPPRPGSVQGLLLKGGHIEGPRTTLPPEVLDNLMTSTQFTSRKVSLAGNLAAGR